MEKKIEERVVDNIANDRSERLIKLLREMGVSDGIIMITLFGIGSNTEYYNVLYNRINNLKEEITDDVVRREALEIFHEIDRNEYKK